jgi:hypothetical protein
MILFAFADFIQSPDETIVLDICMSLITVVQLEAYCDAPNSNSAVSGREIAAGMWAKEWSVIDVFMKQGLLGEIRLLCSALLCSALLFSAAFFFFCSAPLCSALFLCSILLLHASALFFCSVLSILLLCSIFLPN